MCGLPRWTCSFDIVLVGQKGVYGAKVPQSKECVMIPWAWLRWAVVLVIGAWWGWEAQQIPAYWAYLEPSSAIVMQARPLLLFPLLEDTPAHTHTHTHTNAHSHTPWPLAGHLGKIYEPVPLLKARNLFPPEILKNLPRGQLDSSVPSCQ